MLHLANAISAIQGMVFIQKHRPAGSRWTSQTAPPPWPNLHRRGVVQGSKHVHHDPLYNSQSVDPSLCHKYHDIRSLMKTPCTHKTRRGRTWGEVGIRTAWFTCVHSNYPTWLSHLSDLRASWANQACEGQILGN